MGIQLFTLFTLFIFAKSLFAQINQFESLTFTNVQSEFSLKNNNPNKSSFSVRLSDRIRFLPASEAKSLVPNYDPNTAYFKIAHSSNGERPKVDIFKMPKEQFEEQIANAQYTNYLKNQYLLGRVNSVKKRFDGKNFTIQSSDIEFSSGNQKIQIKAGEKIQLVKSSNLSKIPNVKDDLIYFQVIDPKSNRPIPNKYYSISQFKLEEEFQKDNLGKWERKEYEKLSAISLNQIRSTKKAPKKRESSPITPELQKKYTLKDNVQKIPITLRYPEQSGLFLGPGEEFYLEEGRDQNYLVKPPHTGRYIINDWNALNSAFKEGAVTVGKKVINKPPQIDLPSKKTSERAKLQNKEKDESHYASEPTLIGSATTAVKTINQLENENTTTISKNCQDYDINPNKVYETCNSSNNYVQDLLKTLVTEEDKRVHDKNKLCIIAGLKRTPRKDMHFARCANSNLLGTGSPICQSKEYVSFIYKEMSQASKCFNNITVEEIIPLVSAESKFNTNAFNYNTGEKSLNASGLLQSTQDVIKSQSIILNQVNKPTMFNNKGKYCQAIYSELKSKSGKIPTSRNVCQRTNIPMGARKNMFIAMAQYSYFKDYADKEMKEIEQTYLNGKQIFDFKTREKIKIDIARLMHNRGNARISTLLEMFFYDLFRGNNHSSKTRNAVIGKRKLDKLNAKGGRIYEPVPGKPDEPWRSVTHWVNAIRTHPHGNPNIYPLWGRPSFKAPLTQDSFVKYFSSYVFYEAERNKIGEERSNQGNTKVIQKVYKKHNRKNIEPNEELQAEGGTYLYKIACEQRLNSLAAQKISGDKNINCDYPQSSEDRLNAIRLDVGWYNSVCFKENESNTSRRKCVAKNPKNATRNGKRRFTDKQIKRLEGDDSILRLCHKERLRGLAARPLAEFYSKEPEIYK